MGKGLNNWPFRHFWCPPFHLLGGLQDVVGLQQIDPFLHRDQVLHRRHDLAEPRVAVGDDDSVTGNTAKIRDGLLSKKYLKSWVWYFLMCLCVFFGWLLNTVDMFCYFWWGWMAENIQNRVLNQKKKLGVPTTTSHNACVVRPSIGNPINIYQPLGPENQRPPGPPPAIQGSVSRLVTSPKSGWPILPPAVTGKPVKPSLLFNSSNSWHPQPAIHLDPG